MADTVYDIAIQLSFAQVGVASGVAAAMGAFKQLSQEASVAEQAVMRLDQQMAMQGMSKAEQQAYRYSAAIEAQAAAQQKLNDATAAFGKLLVGGALFTGGLMGFSLIGNAVTQAQQMQNAMTALGLATVGSLPSSTLAQTIIDTAGKTQFSFAQVADIAKIAATNGLNNRTVLNAALPTLTNVAEIDNRLRGIAPDQSAAASVQIAHLFQSYPTNAAQSAAFAQLLDLAGRAQLVSGLSPDEMVRSVTQLAPARSTLDISPQDIISFSALAGNVGLVGGHGGASRLAAMFRTMAPRPGTQAAKAVGEIESIAGGNFFNSSGQFEGITNALNIVMQFLSKDKDQQQRIQVLNEAFKSAGSQAFATLSTPGAIARYKSIESLLGPPSEGGLASTSQMQHGLNSTLTGQLTDLKTNVASLGAVFGTALIPPLTTVVGLLSKVVGGLAEFGAQHSTLMSVAAWAVTFGSALMTVSGAVLMFKGAWALLNLSGMTGAIGAVIDAVKALGASQLLLAADEDVATASGVALVGMQSVAAAVSGAAAAAFGLIDGAVVALSGGFDIASIAAGALDLALGPEIIAVGALVAVVGGAIYAFSHWGQVSDWLKDQLHSVAVEVDQFNKSHSSGTTPIVGGVGNTIVGTGGPANSSGFFAFESWIMARLFGTGGGSAPRPSGTGGGSAPSAHSTRTTHVHPGAIVIHPAPSQSPKAIAQAVMRELSAQWGDEHKWGTAGLDAPLDPGWDGY